MAQPKETAMTEPYWKNGQDWMDVAVHLAILTINGSMHMEAAMSTVCVLSSAIEAMVHDPSKYMK